MVQPILLLFVTTAALFCNLQLQVSADVPVLARRWTVNLDLPPEQGWPIKEMFPIYNKTLWEAVALIDKFIPSEFQWIAESLALDILPHLGKYAEEITAGAKLIGISLGKAVLLNIIYEAEAGCTSIITQDQNNVMLHGRNLDFDLAETLRKLVVELDFQKGGKTLYRGTSYVGYFGLLTGMRSGAFSISANERDTGYLFENLLEALLVKGTYAACFLIRDTLEQETTFDAAVKRLAETPVAAPIYIIVGGVNPGEGAVITRDRSKAADIWKIDTASGRWFEVETNWDHWSPPGDNRRQTAIDHMNSTGRANTTLGSIFDVLSVKPVLNSDTTYTTTMSAASGSYTTWVRNETTH